MVLISCLLPVVYRSLVSNGRSRSMLGSRCIRLKELRQGHVLSHARPHFPADLLETYVNPRLDWAERRFRPYVNDVKLKARNRREEIVKRARSKQEIKNLEKELRKLRGKVSAAGLVELQKKRGRRKLTVVNSPTALERSLTESTNSMRDGQTPRQCVCGTKSPSSSAS